MVLDTNPISRSITLNKFADENFPIGGRSNVFLFFIRCDLLSFTMPFDEPVRLAIKLPFVVYVLRLIDYSLYRYLQTWTLEVLGDRGIFRELVRN